MLIRYKNTPQTLPYTEEKNHKIILCTSLAVALRLWKRARQLSETPVGQHTGDPLHTLLSHINTRIRFVDSGP
jgi:hypothetical protein